MVFEEYLATAAATGRPYEQLPERVRTAVSPQAYNQLIRDVSITVGQAWASSSARNVCTESEYYTALVRIYKEKYRLYPYHVASYVNRVLRVSPFKYYIDLLFQALKNELSYDRLPNFMAADALRLTGVGRNQYIDIMNQCKAKKLMWRVNKGLARDLLPQGPLELSLEPWWGVAVVNVGEAEFASLSPAEHDLLREACSPAWSGSGAPVSLFDGALLQQLHRKGLIYFDIPVDTGDKFSIPPLEGFVSNKTSDAADGGVDPMEVLLYSVLMAASGRLTVKELGGILQVDLERLGAALSLAVRLGFAKRITSAAAAGGGAGPAANPGPASAGSGSNLQLNLLEDDDQAGSSPSAAAHSSSFASGLGEQLSTALSSQGDQAEEGGEAVAVVVDAEVTSYLMMGALSPGLKKHSVTLFEAGRVGDAEVIQEFISELLSSYQLALQLEGELAHLGGYLAGLATLLQSVQQAGGEGAEASAAPVPLELLRKESLQGLAPSAAAAMLAHSYSAVVPITPLPGPPLPLQLGEAGPTFYGPSSLSGTPWLQLALYAAAGCGPPGLVLVSGQQLTQLPPLLAGSSHALVWGWQQPQMAAAGHKCWWEEQQPLLAEGQFLLATLNDLLTQTAVLVQPWPPPASSLAGPVPDPLAAAEQLQLVDIPLPLPAATTAAAGGAAAEAGGSGSGTGQGVTLQGVQSDVGCEVEAVLPGALVAALQELGLASCVGVLRLARYSSNNTTSSSSSSNTTSSSSGGPASAVAGAGTLRTAANSGSSTSTNPSTSSSSSSWMPLRVQLGVPLTPLALTKLVCGRMVAAQVLSPTGQQQQREGQLLLHQHLSGLVGCYGPLQMGPARPWQHKPLQQPAASPRSAAAGTSAVGKEGDQLQQQLSVGVLDCSLWSGMAVQLLGLLPAADLVFDGQQLGRVGRTGQAPLAASYEGTGAGAAAAAQLLQLQGRPAADHILSN